MLNELEYTSTVEKLMMRFKGELDSLDNFEDLGDLCRKYGIEDSYLTIVNDRMEEEARRNAIKEELEYKKTTSYKVIRGIAVALLPGYMAYCGAKKVLAH